MIVFIGAEKFSSLAKVKRQCLTNSMGCDIVGLSGVKKNFVGGDAVPK